MKRGEVFCALGTLQCHYSPVCGECIPVPPHPLGSYSLQNLTWKACTKLGHWGWISEGLNPVFLVSVTSFKRRCDESGQVPALRTEFHGLVPVPCIQSMVFSSLAWLHRTSQHLILCGFFVWFYEWKKIYFNLSKSSVSFQCTLKISNKCTDGLEYCIWWYRCSSHGHTYLARSAGQSVKWRVL